MEHRNQVVDCKSNCQTQWDYHKLLNAQKHIKIKEENQAKKEMLGQDV